MNSTAAPSNTPRRNARPKDSACSASPSGREPRVYRSNPYEAAARSRKVYALASAIESNWPLETKPTVAEVRALSISDWKTVAEFCGKRAPSAETINAVIRHFEIREENAQKDPFRGLPRRAS